MGKTICESKYYEKKHIDKFKFLIGEYLKVKSKQHPVFNELQKFYESNNIDRRVFLKYFHRYQNEPAETSLLPQKRGPKYKTRRPLPLIENKVVELRLLGNNRYEISNMLKAKLKKSTPSPSGVYEILKRKGLNRMTQSVKATKRRIIKKRAGELAHVDCHYLRPGIVKSEPKKTYFLVSLMDDCTRITLTEVIADLKSLTVMFAILRMINMMHTLYEIKFKELLSDNGAEFGNKNMKAKMEHPFERMLIELGIKHRYTRPYHPQTNGKIERYWRTMNEDMLEDVECDNLESLKQETLEYVTYYDYERPHQALGGVSPVTYLSKVEKVK